MRPYLFDDVPQLIPSRLVGEEVCRKRVLGANRFSYPIGADAAIIDGARRPIKVGTRLPKMLLQEIRGLRPEVESGSDPCTSIEIDLRSTSSAADALSAVLAAAVEPAGPASPASIVSTEARAGLHIPAWCIEP